MEANEHRFSSSTIISAWGLSFSIISLVLVALFMSLAGMTSLTPLFASTLAVSAPMPEVAPICIHNHKTLMDSEIRQFNEAVNKYELHKRAFNADEKHSEFI